MNLKSTILIVDDEPVMREIMEGLLMAEDYTLAFAGGGTAALAKATALTPDLILLDVMMPDMDGFEVCRRLRADPLLAEVPVIMVTALDDRPSRLRGIKVGADDFVTKPFDAVELQTRVQTIVRLNRYRRLLSERSKFRWVVEQAEDGFLILSDQGDILYANTQARLYLGLPADQNEAISGTFLELIKPQYLCEPQAAWAIWPEQPDQAPLYLVRPESATADAFWLQVELMDMAARSNERYLVCLRDITPNVVVRRVMWTFHDQVGHKLKTPLTLLTGFLDLLREDPSAISATEANSILELAHKNAIRLQNEVMSIFDYMQGPDIGKLGPVHCSLTDIPEIINRVKVDLELESIKISQAEFLSSADMHIPISDQAMEQILWEILGNAQKFHPEQAPHLEIKISNFDQEVKIQIWDDGLTLSPTQLAKMWTPYYQAEKYFSGQVPGMGLGLSTVSSMIWSVGGACNAYNRTDGPGIIVELVIPWRQNGPEA